MSLYARLLRERDEEERRRGCPSGRSENTLSTVFARKPVDTSGNQSPSQRRIDLQRMRSYFRYWVTNRFEAMHLAHLRR
jgi:hypothetical protein